MLWGIQAYAQHQDPPVTDPQNMKVEPGNTDCHKLPDTLEDLTEALSAFENYRFYYDQSIKTTRRRGLMQARFLSCDFSTGYLVVRYDSVDQVFPQVSISLWKEFQATSDIDGFYFKRIEKLPKITANE